MAVQCATSVTTWPRIDFDVFGVKKQKGAAAGDEPPFVKKTAEVL